MKVNKFKFVCFVFFFILLLGFLFFVWQSVDRRSSDGPIAWISLDNEEDIKLSELRKIGSNYYTDEQDVYYVEFLSCQYADIDNPPECNMKKKLKGVDLKNFKVLGEEMFNSDFAKDKNNVYLEGERIKEFDPTTFEVLDYWYIKDKNKVYNGYNSGEDNSENLMKNVDPATFEILNDEIVKDKNMVIYRGDVIKGADANSFHIVGELYDSVYSCDKNYAYINDYIITNADLDSFEIVDRLYSKDKYNVYYLWNIESNNTEQFNISEEDRGSLEKVSDCKNW